jgi:hypothetical protein
MASHDMDALIGAFICMYIYLYINVSVFMCIYVSMYEMRIIHEKWKGRKMKKKS